MLDVPAAEANRRRALRGGAPELYEDDLLQQRLEGVYAQIEKHFPNDRIVHVDGTLPLEGVAATVLAAVRQARGEST